MLKEKINYDENIVKDIILLKFQERCKEILQIFKNFKLRDVLESKITDLIKINFEKFNKDKKLNINKPARAWNYLQGWNNVCFRKYYSKCNIHSRKFVTVELNYNKKNVKITITDDGSGFSKEIIDKLGEPYISKNNQGMGLGIFIAKNLIVNMGGNLAFYNSIDDKAVVEITFDNSILSIWIWSY